MLLAFSVTNFKSIRDTQTLSMVGSSLKGPHSPMPINFPGGGAGILPCAIIYGANASGKSNLLEAFTRMHSMIFTSQARTLRDEKIRWIPFLLDESASAKPTSFEVSFLRNDVRYDYGFEHDDVSIHNEWLFSYPEGRRRKLFERQGMEVSFGPAMRGSKKLLASFLKGNTLFLTIATQNEHPDLSPVTEFFDDVFALNQISVASRALNQSFAKEEVDSRSIKFLGAVGTGVCAYKLETSDISEENRKKISELVKVLAAHSDIEIPEGGIPIEEKEYEVKLGHRSTSDEIVYMGGESESAGTRRLLLLMNNIFRVLDSGDIAFIDEIDASLHTFAVQAIVNLFVDPQINRKGAQLIATTHDTNLLDPELLRRDEIWFSEKAKNGASEYFSLAEIKSRKREVFEKSYLQGRYGAVPDFLDKSMFI